MITIIAEPQDYSAEAVRLYKKLGPVYFLPVLKSGDKEKIFKNAGILVVRLGHKIDKNWLDKLPNLKVIATPTTGLNHIDMEEAKKRGVKVISLRGRTSFLKFIPSTAEETFALLLALIRNVPWAHEHVVKGGWNRDLFKGRQLRQKIFGILGFGRLGKICAKYARAFGMEVIACDPFVPASIMKKFRVKKVAMDALFKKSDILSLHVLLTEKTADLVKEAHLKMMKPGSLLINTARAEVLENGALYIALKNKWIAGAAIDVMRNESQDGKHLKKDPLWKYAGKNKNLLIVPHLGGATYEAMQVTEDFIAGVVLKYFRK